ncbi:unnamed protein product [Auanema sp. JU1783]|nr:unnamed protein product [Auanema sp. JU1783]
MPYTTQKSLMIHARTHFKKMGYSCSDCGALFFQYVAASNHISLCHMGTLAVVRDILTNEDMRDLEKCMRECFTTDSLFPVKATYIPKLNLLPKPLLQATDSNSSVGSDVICIDDSDDDIGSVDVQGIGLPLREGH